MLINGFPILSGNILRNSRTSDFDKIRKLIKNINERTSIIGIPIMYVTWKQYNANEIPAGIINIKASSFQIMSILILLAMIIDTINPITDPNVNAIAAPSLPYNGTSVKYNKIRD